MCGTCGCSDFANAVTITDPAKGETTLLRRPAHDHDHPHDHHHHHDGDDRQHAHGPHGEVIALEQAVLAENDRCRAEPRLVRTPRRLGIEPGQLARAGKTTLLERTIQRPARWRSGSKATR